jgi:hypothetical protein
MGAFGLIHEFWDMTLYRDKTCPEIPGIPEILELKKYKILEFHPCYSTL